VYVICALRVFDVCNLYVICVIHQHMQSVYLTWAELNYKYFTKQATVSSGCHLMVDLNTLMRLNTLVEIVRDILFHRHQGMIKSLVWW
jgi:hypothetical protein